MTIGPKSLRDPGQEGGKHPPDAHTVKFVDRFDSQRPELEHNRPSLMKREDDSLHIGLVEISKVRSCKLCKLLAFDNCSADQV